MYHKWVNYMVYKLYLLLTSKKKKKKNNEPNKAYLQAWHCLQTLQFRVSALYLLIYWMFYSKHPLPWQTAIELVAERTDMPLIILEARVSRSGYCKVNTILQPLLLAYSSHHSLYAHMTYSLSTWEDRQQTSCLVSFLIRTLIPT